MKEAGFDAVEYAGTTGFRTSAFTFGALFRAKRP